MTALALFEAKKVARNPLLWLGAALLAAFGWLNAREFWPIVPEDAGYAYQGVVVLAAFALLVGAWVGLRDRTSNATTVIASTPLHQKGLLVPARMAALAATGFCSFALVVAFVAAFSFARGGNGWPDAYLVLDGGLYVALAACVGFGIGFLTGSRIGCLLAAPLLPGIDFYLQGQMTGQVRSPIWILPHPQLPPRFGPLGYLPDVLPLHSAYLAGGLLAVAGVVWFVGSRRERTGSPGHALATAVVGAGVFVGLGGWLAVQPVQVQPLGTAETPWIAVDSTEDYRALNRALRHGIPDNGLASECAEDDGVTVCIFPEHGAEVAEALASDASDIAPFMHLQGVPERFRMVPAADFSDVSSCAGGEYLFGSTRYTDDYWKYGSLARNAFYCAVYGPRMLTNRSADALQAWFDARLIAGRSGDAYMRYMRRYGIGGRMRETIEGLGALSVDEVVDRLEPVWRDIRARRLTLTELEAALGR